MATSIKQFKPKLLNTIDGLIAHLQADDETPNTEWQSLMIAREVVAGASVIQLARAIAKAAEKQPNGQGQTQARLQRCADCCGDPKCCPGHAAGHPASRSARHSHGDR